MISSTEYLFLESYDDDSKHSIKINDKQALKGNAFVGGQHNFIKIIIFEKVCLVITVYYIVQH